MVLCLYINRLTRYLTNLKNLNIIKNEKNRKNNI